jgi:hypothetical protein
MDLSGLYSPTHFSLMDYTASLVIVVLLLVILWALMKIDEIKEQTEKKNRFKDIDKLLDR